MHPRSIHTNETFNILLFLFTLKSNSLYIYFTSHPIEYRCPTVNSIRHADHSLSHLPMSVKPWPILPSYLSWTQNAHAPYLSCEVYFGIGFNQCADLLPLIQQNHQALDGWFRCSYSQTLRSLVCDGGNIRMVAERNAMSRGGEKLESVIGRGEDAEIRNFEDGAFQVEATDRLRIGEKLVDLGFLDRYVKEGQIHRHTMRRLIASIRFVDSSEFVCSEDSLGRNMERNVLIGPICFRHVVLAALSYETPLSKGLIEHMKEVPVVVLESTSNQMMSRQNGKILPEEAEEILKAV